MREIPDHDPCIGYAVQRAPGLRLVSQEGEFNRQAAAGLVQEHVDAGRVSLKSVPNIVGSGFPVGLGQAVEAKGAG